MKSVKLLQYKTQHVKPCLSMAYGTTCPIWKWQMQSEVQYGFMPFTDSLLYFSMLSEMWAFIFLEEKKFSICSSLCHAVAVHWDCLQACSDEGPQQELLRDSINVLRNCCMFDWNIAPMITFLCLFQTIRFWTTEIKSKVYWEVLGVAEPKYILGTWALSGTPNCKNSFLSVSFSRYLSFSNLQ